MINFAVYQYKKSLLEIKGINCPDNHNLKKKKQETQMPDIEKHVTSKLNLKFITNDFVLPPKAIKIGECLKKNRTMGYEKRYLMLGHSQLLISRDKELKQIVALIPLEGGFCMIKKPRDYGGLVIESTFRQYKFKFSSATDLIDWYQKVQQVASKEFKLKKYQKRVDKQTEMMQQENVQFLYSSTLQQIELQFKALRKHLQEKVRIEQEDKDRVDFQQKDIHNSIQRVNQSANYIFQAFFFQNQLAQMKEDIENGTISFSTQ